ncbi:MAG: bifunctional DNA-formamidopyrimidine glycosylase/DNA-(apurinic or apyrimidinic site) lyase [Mariprofundaceae bacterium]|nr:bifunctional DNA-formamidopyrimidine glycosylase/DNA-(apurinic or apyrimidinic site) lyase [Mariprofundaceae bacterium]
MPELPEVEVVRRSLESLLLGRKVTSVSVGCASLRYPVPANLRASLVGQTFRKIGRRAKYLLFGFNDVLLSWHLGMTGRFHVLSVRNPVMRHEHVRFDLENGLSLRYCDARRFGYAGLLDVEDWRCHPWFRNLGVEPLSDGFDGRYLYEQCRRHRSTIKSLLLSGRVVVGVGNIYASEALYHAGIHPARRANQISCGRMNHLALSIKNVLSEAIMAGGSSVSDFIRVDGRPGYFTRQLAVYGRQGKACARCSRRIQRKPIAGRSSFYCPGCQH